MKMRRFPLIAVAEEPGVPALGKEAPQASSPRPADKRWRRPLNKTQRPHGDTPDGNRRD